MASFTDGCRSRSRGLRSWSCLTLSFVNFRFARESFRFWRWFGSMMSRKEPRSRFWIAMIEIVPGVNMCLIGERMLRLWLK